MLCIITISLMPKYTSDMIKNIVDSYVPRPVPASVALLIANMDAQLSEKGGGTGGTDSLSHPHHHHKYKESSVIYKKRLAPPDKKRVMGPPPEPVNELKQCIHTIRISLNKMTDLNFDKIRGQIMDGVCLIAEKGTQEELATVSSTVFELASTNRFYSKQYADIYSTLYHAYPLTMHRGFESGRSGFMAMFDNIECIDQNADYEKFCEVNKINERRKALAAFLRNLSTVKTDNSEPVISMDTFNSLIVSIIQQLDNKMQDAIHKSTVDELVEVFSVMVQPNAHHSTSTIPPFAKEFIMSIAKAKGTEKGLGTRPGLSNKSLFKFMDMADGKLQK